MSTQQRMQQNASQVFVAWGPFKSGYLLKTQRLFTLKWRKPRIVRFGKGDNWNPRWRVNFCLFQRETELEFLVRDFGNLVFEPNLVGGFLQKPFSLSPLPHRARNTVSFPNSFSLCRTEAYCIRLRKKKSVLFFWMNNLTMSLILWLWGGAGLCPF